MVTRADVKIDNPFRATLTQNGKTLAFRVLEPPNATIEIYRTDPPPSAIDARNEGTRMIGFKLQVAAKQSQRIVVELVPGDVSPTDSAVTPLASW